MATHAKPSEATRRVSVGSVPLGGGAPVVVQSMLNAPATDVAANLAQIDAPAPLTGLDARPVRFGGCVDKAQMLHTVDEFLK